MRRDARQRTPIKRLYRLYITAGATAALWQLQRVTTVKARRAQSQGGEQITEEGHIKAALYQIDLNRSSVDDRTEDPQR